MKKQWLYIFHTKAVSPSNWLCIIIIYGTGYSLQNKIWNLPDRSTILPKLIYDKEKKLAWPTQILPVSVCGPALILETEGINKMYSVKVITWSLLLTNEICIMIHLKFFSSIICFCCSLCLKQWGYASVYRKRHLPGFSSRRVYMQLDEATLTFNADPELVSF